MLSKYWQEKEEELVKIAKEEAEDESIKLIDYEFNVDIDEYVALYKTSDKFVVAWIAYSEFVNKSEADTEEKARSIFNDDCNELMSHKEGETWGKLEIDFIEFWIREHNKAFRMKYICNQAGVNYDRYKNWSSRRYSLKKSELSALKEAMKNASKQKREQNVPFFN